MSARSFVVGLVACAALGLLGLSLSRDRAPAQQAPAKVKWEYCTLFQTATLAEEGSTFRVVLPDRVHEGKTYKEIGQKLGMRNAPDAPTDLLNALGADGWELTTQVDNIRENGLLRTWTFRRPR
ncbi:MAG: hypothetical protein IT429_03945 [Gemmataceae bacterium]|nr:hypothetical protein [Gemmataceae bacterium]